MFCPKCRYLNRDDASFCHRCGYRFVVSQTKQPQYDGRSQGGYIGGGSGVIPSKINERIIYRDRPRMGSADIIHLGAFGLFIIFCITPFIYFFSILMIVIFSLLDISYLYMCLTRVYCITNEAVVVKWRGILIKRYVRMPFAEIEEVKKMEYIRVIGIVGLRSPPLSSNYDVVEIKRRNEKRKYFYLRPNNPDEFIKTVKSAIRGCS